MQDLVEVVLVRVKSLRPEFEEAVMIANNTEVRNWMLYIMSPPAAR